MQMLEEEQEQTHFAESSIPTHNIRAQQQKNQTVAENAATKPEQDSEEPSEDLVILKRIKECHAKRQEAASHCSALAQNIEDLQNRLEKLNEARHELVILLKQVRNRYMHARRHLLDSYVHDTDGDDNDKDAIDSCRLCKVKDRSRGRPLCL